MSAIIGVLALFACNSVSGDIDTYKVNINTAVFVEDEEAYGNDGSIQILLASHGLSCEEWYDFTDDFWDQVQALDFEDAEDEWKEALPEDFWELTIVMRVDDIDQKQRGLEYTGVDWDDPIADDDEAKIHVSHYTDYPDADDIFDDIADHYVSDEGILQVTGHSPGEHIKGNFKTTVKDLDGDTEGEITVRFNADRCEQLEKFYY